MQVPSSDSVSRYTSLASPLGKLLLVAKGDELEWLCLEGQRFVPELAETRRQDDWPLFGQVKQWLSDYFAGKNPSLKGIPLAPSGSSFRLAVWKMLLEIPYGKTVSYGELAKKYAIEHGMQPCAQAIGGAVGHNPISILIPCHRVISANNSLGGYGGGLVAKQYLLQLEASGKRGT